MTTLTYSRATIVVHWLTTCLIAASLLTGWATVTPENPNQPSLWLQVHIGLGSMVLLVAVYHIYLRFKHPRPAALETGSAFQNKFRSILHRILTLFILVLGATGLASSFSSSTSTFTRIHSIQAIVFIGFIGWHIWHVWQYQRQHGKAILRRMNL